MVIITETLTSTSHHDIFTYLDYIFPATFIYIYIYIYSSTDIAQLAMAVEYTYCTSAEG